MDFNEIQNNFFGMSLEKQIQFIEMIKNNSNINLELKEEFISLFDDYYEKIKSLLNANKEYPSLNSYQRRYLRLEAFSSFVHIFESHHCDNSVENEIACFKYHHAEDFYFCSSSDFKMEIKRYFYPDIISNEDADKYIEEFYNMSTNNQNIILSDINISYNNMDNFYMHLPFPQNIVDTYNDLVDNILGKDFSKYYNLLYPTEKVRIIEDIAFRIMKTKHLDKESIIIEDKDALKKQKARSIGECERALIFM